VASPGVTDVAFGPRGFEFNLDGDTAGDHGRDDVFDRVDRHDVRVGLGVARTRASRDTFRVAGRGRRDGLESLIAPELRVVGTLDFAHPSGADGRQKPRTGRVGSLTSTPRDGWRSS
jgi:hypothetical protein